MARPRREIREPAGAACDGLQPENDEHRREGAKRNGGVHVGQEQRGFIDAFGEHVLPELSKAGVAASVGS